MSKRGSYAKWKDADWTIQECEDGSGVANCHEALLCVLMDVRRELKALNSVIGCFNTRRIPTILDTIAANTRKPRKRRKASPAKAA